MEVFVDQLSTWYLRRSRRRFWKSDADADKQAAYATLYSALTTLSKLLAPTMPFLADELYQNLVRSLDDTAPESVHLADWPTFDPSMIDESLNAEMALTMKLASLGHAARNKANRKVRQPLAEVAYALGSVDEKRVLLKYADILEDELNVKQVRVLDAAGEAVSFVLNPLPKQLGQKYGKLFPAIRKVVTEMPSDEGAKRLLKGQNLIIEVEGQMVELMPDEVEVRAQAKAGFAVASEGAYLAALVTDLTPELVKEGLAREFVRRVQDLRKQQDLDISDRIRIQYAASDGLASGVEAFREYVMGETLTVQLTRAEGSSDWFQDSFDGETLAVKLEKVQK